MWGKKIQKQPCRIYKAVFVLRTGLERKSVYRCDIRSGDGF